MCVCVCVGMFTPCNDGVHVLAIRGGDDVMTDHYMTPVTISTNQPVTTGLT